MRSKTANQILKELYCGKLLPGQTLILQKYLDDVNSAFRELEAKKIIEWRKLGKVREINSDPNDKYYRKGRYYITEDEEKLVESKIDVEYELKKEIKENFGALDFTEKEISEIFAFAKKIKDSR